MDQAVHKQVGYGPAAAFVFTIASFFGSQLLAGLSVGFFPLLLGWDQQRVEAWLTSGTLAQAIIITLSGIFTVLLMQAFLVRRKTTFADLGLKAPQVAALWQAALGFVVYFVSFLLLATIVKQLIPGLDLEQEQDLGFDFTRKENIALLAFSLVIVPPIIEELVMRGFLFTGLRTKLPFIGATILTSLLFAAAHLPGGKEGLLWIGALDTFVLSIVLCYLREKTGNLWPCILLHAMKNSVALIYLVYLS